MGIFDVFTGEGYRDAADAKAAGIARARASAFENIDRGSADMSALYGEARNVYDPLYRGSLAGFRSYGDALGLGGMSRTMLK